MTPHSLIPYLKDSFKALGFKVDISKSKDWLRVVSTQDQNFFIVSVTEESPDHISIYFSRSGVKALVYVMGVPPYVSMAKILDVCMNALKLKKSIY